MRGIVGAGCCALLAVVMSWGAVGPTLAKPRPGVDVVVLFDTSASSQDRRLDKIALINRVVRRLDPHRDRMRLFVFHSTISCLHDGPPRLELIDPLLKKYTRHDRQDEGTCYGKALSQGLREVKAASRQGRDSALLILGDGADETVPDPKGNIDWGHLTAQFKHYPANSSAWFLFVDPETGTTFRNRLRPLLGERFQMYPPETSTVPRVINAILRRLRR